MAVPWSLSTSGGHISQSLPSDMAWTVFNQSLDVHSFLPLPLSQASISDAPEA